MVYVAFFAWQFWNVFSCSNQTVFVNPKSLYLVVFFWCRQDKKGLVGLKYIPTVWRNKGTWVHLERCILDVSIELF